MQRSRTGRLIVALLLMLLFVLGVVVLVVEMWVKPAVEREIADGVADELALSTRPDVSIRGFPLALHALRESVEGLDISVDGEEFEGLRVEQVELHVDEVVFSSNELLGGGGTIEVAGGDGTATITDDDLTDYLTGTGLPIAVRFEQGAVRATGTVSVAGISADASVEGELVLAGDVLRFTPTTVDASAFTSVADVGAVESEVIRQFTFQTPVPVLEGVTLTEVRVGDGVATIGATFGFLAITY